MQLLYNNKIFSNKLHDTCKPIEVDNVLLSTAMIAAMFYPDAITDGFEHTLNIEKLLTIIL